MGVYLYPSGTETELKNAYIGEYGWQPGANTLLYMKFDGNLKDEVSGTNGTAVSNPSYRTLTSGIKVLDCSTSGYVLTPSVAMNTALTLCCWMASINASGGIVRCDAPSGTRNFYGITKTPTGTDGGWYYGSTWRGGGNTTSETWSLLTLTCGSTGINLYVDGVNVYTNSYTSFVWKTQQRGVAYDQHDRVRKPGQFSNLIIENRAWTADEISNYYNMTKSEYGIS